MGSDSMFRDEYEDESSTSKFGRKAKDSPFVPLGIAGMVVVCGIGAYKFNRRGDMMPSMFLMQLRVAAQSAVVGTISLGLVYSMAQKYIFNKPSTDEQNNDKTDHR